MIKLNYCSECRYSAKSQRRISSSPLPVVHFVGPTDFILSPAADYQPSTPRRACKHRRTTIKHSTGLMTPVATQWRRTHKKTLIWSWATLKASQREKDDAIQAVSLGSAGILAAGNVGNKTQRRRDGGESAEFRIRLTSRNRPVRM